MLTITPPMRLIKQGCYMKQKMIYFTMCKRQPDTGLKMLSVQINT